MFPGGFPILPAMVFPSVALPALPTGGLDAFDVTAALAAVVFGIAGLVAVRIAIAMSRDEEAPSRIVAPMIPSNAGERTRKAA